MTIAPASFGQNNPDLPTAVANGLYTAILGRPPDPAGLAITVQQLKAGVPVKTLAAELFGSDESRKLQVARTYQNVLGREADPGGAVVNLQKMQSGQTAEQLAVFFFSTDEFLNRARATVTGGGGAVMTVVLSAALLLSAINQARAANSPALPPMTLNNNLEAMAQEHASFMAKVGILSHDDAGDGTFLERLYAAGYRTSLEAEEIIATGSSVADAMSEWMSETPPNDPHRQAILSACRDIGCASATAANGLTYYCCDMGIPG